MKLFFWESEALRECGTGSIIVMAESVEAARQIVKDQAGTQCCDHHMLIQDMVDDPEVLEGADAVVFIRGSE